MPKIFKVKYSLKNWEGETNLYLDIISLIIFIKIFNLSIGISNYRQLPKLSFGLLTES